MTNEERKEYYMNRNVKLYPFYLSITWDVLFVWTMLSLFYTQEIGLTYSQAIMLDSVQTLVSCVICIPVTKWFTKMKPVKASRIGNLGYIGFLLVAIFCPHGSGPLTIFVLSLGHTCLAFGYCVFIVKNVSILNQSLQAVERNKDYERVYGKGVSLYYVWEAITAILATYLYSWSHYAPLWGALIVVCVAELYSLLLKEPVKFQTKNVEIQPRLTYKERKARKPDSFIKILASTFVITLLIYAALTRGVMSMDTSQFRLYLNQLTEAGTIPIWLYGYIFAFMRMCMALSSRYQFKFNLKFGVRSLIIFITAYMLLTISAGFVFVFMPDSLFKVVLLLALMILTCCIRSPNQIFLNNYMQVCTPTKNYEKMYALRTIADYLGYALLNMFYAQLLNVFSDNFGYANFVFVGVLAIPLIVSLIVFIKVLTKKFAQKYTIIKEEYTED